MHTMCKGELEHMLGALKACALRHGSRVSAQLRSQLQSTVCMPARTVHTVSVQHISVSLATVAAVGHLSEALSVCC
jgi:hypothetical protein